MILRLENPGKKAIADARIYGSYKCFMYVLLAKYKIEIFKYFKINK